MYAYICTYWGISFFVHQGGPGPWFRVPGCGFRVLGSGSGPGSRVPGPRFPAPVPGCTGPGIVIVVAAAAAAAAAGLVVAVAVVSCFVAVAVVNLESDPVPGDPCPSSGFRVPGAEGGGGGGGVPGDWRREKRYSDIRSCQR